MNYFKETIKLFENSTLFYAIAIGMDSNYSYVSPNYNRNFDFLNESLLGKPYHITMHPDDTHICGEVAAQCFANPHQLFPAVLRKHDGNGGFVFTQWEFKALFNENNEPDGIFCFGFNITEHIDTRSKLISANTEIEYKKDQLYQIGFIQSHVIRKPLANILGLADLLTSMDAEPHVQDINTRLMESAFELDTVIRSIVDRTA